MELKGRGMGGGEDKVKTRKKVVIPVNVGKGC